MAEWLSQELEVKLIVMWQAQPELYEVISKEYYNIIKRMLVVLAYMCLWPFAHGLPFCVFACLCRR